MHRMTGFAALLAAAVMTVAPIGIAAAQQTGAPPKAGGPQGGPPQGGAQQGGAQQGGVPDMKAALDAFGQAKTSLSDAVAAGEKQAGGKAVDATFGGGPTNPAFRVTVYKDKSLWEGLFDANTGQPVGQSNTIPESQLDAQEKADLAGVEQAKTTLAQAIKAAEQAGGGKAIDAGIEQRGGKMSYEIAVVKNGAVQPMTVDPTTGTATVATSPPDAPKQK